LQAELKMILEDAADRPSMKTASELAREIRSKLGGRVHTDSVEMLREDRER
jgi:hypothetical protein